MADVTLLADSPPDGPMFDFLKMMVFYVISPLVLAVTGAVGILLKWNKLQQDEITSLKAERDAEKKTRTQLELEKGQLVQKVQELQSRQNLQEMTNTLQDRTNTFQDKVNVRQDQINRGDLK